MILTDRKFVSRIAFVAGVTLFAHMAVAADPVAMPRNVAQYAEAARDTATFEPAIAATSSDDPSPADAVAPTDPDKTLDPRQVDCVAKVVRHEAANQPIDGQFAVAQVIRARMEDGRFPTTACDVVMQRGQFFDVDAYDPPRDDARWSTALRVATETLSGEGSDHARGALFFHAVGTPMPGRTRVARIDGHVFYR